MKKRMITLAMTLVMAMSLAVPAGAVETAESAEEQVSRAVKAAERYAYLDVEKATPAMKEKILEARDVIIFNTDWVADGHQAYYEDAEGNIEALPPFSEVFPGWDVPTVDAEVQVLDLGAMSPQTVTPIPGANLWLKVRELRDKQIYPANSGEHQYSFYVHPHEKGTVVKTVVNSLTKNKVCNIGYTDMYNQKYLSYKVNMKPGDDVIQTDAGYKSLGIRVSANGSLENGTLGKINFTVYAKDREPYSD